MQFFDDEIDNTAHVDKCHRELVVYLCSLKRAESRSEHLVTADDDVTEHGQCDSQPHGGRVGGNGEVNVKQQVDHPAGRVSITWVRHSDAVEVDGVWEVRQHGQQVGNC